MHSENNSWIQIVFMVVILLVLVVLCVLVGSKKHKGQFQPKCGHKQHGKLTEGKSWKLVYTPDWIMKTLGLTRKQRICDVCMDNRTKQEPTKKENLPTGPASSFIPSAASLPQFQVDMPPFQASFSESLPTESQTVGNDDTPSTSWKPKDQPHIPGLPELPAQLTSEIETHFDERPIVNVQSTKPHQMLPPPPVFSFPKPRIDWSALSTISSRVYAKLKLVPGNDPTIVKTVTFKTDGSWLVRIFGRQIDLTSQFPEILPTQMTTDVLNFVDDLILCSGNPDPRYIPMAESRDGKFPQANWIQHVVDDPIYKGTTHTSTIRHNNCPLIIRSGQQCAECSDYGDTLRAMYSRFNRVKTSKEEESRTRSDSKTPLSYLKPGELLIRAKQLSKSLTATKEALTRLLRRSLRQEVTSEGVDVEDTDLSLSLKQVMANDVSTVIKDHPSDSFGHLFWQQQLKALNTDDPRGYRWHPMMIKWCLNLRMASSKAYDIVRSTLKLPNQQTLRRYIHWTDPKSGFTRDSAKQLVKEVSKFKDHQKYCIIVHDEMKIKSDLVYNKHTGKLEGFVDLGGWENRMKDFENEVQKDTEPEKNLAKYLLVFQVRCLLVNFSYPLAHFPTANTKAHEIFSIFWKAVEMCELAGLKVVGVTCDGAATNRRFMNMHGRGKSSTSNPISQVPMPYRNRWTEDHSRKLFLLMDPPHLIKCVRNAWWNKARMLWNNGNITWKQLESLYFADTDKGGLYLTKLTYEHIELTSYSKMKVGLAAQTLSTSVANAMEMNQGVSARAAVEFVRYFDKFFDLLNIRSITEAVRTRKENKEPYQSVDDHRLTWLEKDFIGYLDNWAKAVEERDPENYTNAQRKKMMIPDETMSGLRRTACAYPALARYLLERPGVEFVLSEKVNQDKLEQLFGNVRQMKGGNESPNVTQVNSAMNVLRLKTSQDLKVMRGNTYNKRTIDELEVDDSPLHCKKKAKKQDS